MKYSLYCNQQEKYLKQADEIRISYEYIDNLVDIIEKYPDKNYVLEINSITSYEFAEHHSTVKMANKLAKGNLICSIGYKDIALFLKENDIQFFFYFPITDFYELNAAINLGISYVIPGPELFFSMDYLKCHDVKVRVCPNVAYNDGFEREHGLHGTWILPQQIPMYKDYIDTIYFEDCDPAKERGLFRVYKDYKWVGDIKDIISNFNVDGNNYLFSEETLTPRLNCRHKCEKIPGLCHICDSAVRLSIPERYKKYLKIDKKENI